MQLGYAPQQRAGREARLAARPETVQGDTDPDRIVPRLGQQQRRGARRDVPLEGARADRRPHAAGSFVECRELLAGVALLGDVLGVREMREDPGDLDGIPRLRHPG